MRFTSEFIPFTTKKSKVAEMNYKKNKKPGICDVKRCKERSEQSIDTPDGTMDLCTKHAGLCDNPVTISSAHQTVDPEAVPTPTIETVQDDTKLDNQMVEVRTNADDAIKEVGAYEIKDSSEAAFFEKELAATRTQWKHYESKRTEATKPLNAGLRKVNSWFKPVLTSLKSLEKTINDRLRVYRLEQAMESQRLLAAAQETLEPDIIRETMIAASEAVEDPGSATYIDKWSFRVEDPDLVPRAFLAPDLAKIRQAVAEGKGNCTIPGVLVFNEPTIRTK